MKVEGSNRKLIYAAVLALLCAAAATSVWAQPTKIPPAAPGECALLDTPTASIMDGLLFRLALACNRLDLLGGVKAPQAQGGGALSPDDMPDVQVNDSTNDTGSSTTQSETSIAQNPLTGTLCAGFNDSSSFFNEGAGFTGFARSTDNGQTWFDQGGVNADTFGDPSLVWRAADGNFYFATLGTVSLDIFRSTDDCQSFTKIAAPTSVSDDKELLAVDNSGGAFDGNLYLVWTDFGVDPWGAIVIKTSTDAGVTWSAQLTIGNPTGATAVAQGAWPTVGPDGTLYVAWLEYASWPTGNITVQVARSTNGGASFTTMTSPLANMTSPRDNTASNSCGRPALKGNIRFLASPQIVTTSNGDLHIVYAKDPDGFNVGDVVNVYYRRSSDGGATWGTEIQLNDVGTNDQFVGTIAVGPNDELLATWYDRRLDGANTLLDYFKTTSTDGGNTWSANERVSDVSSPIRLDPSLASCYHGDYDTSLIALDGTQVVQWSDDRNIVGTPPRNDPDVWTDSTPGDGGGGGIPCEDFLAFQARCRANPQGNRIQARARMTDGSHDGETVDISVDGTPNTVTILAGQAQYLQNGASSGAHTVELSDPAGCFAPVVVTCP